MAYQHGKDFEAGILCSHRLKTRVGAGASVLCFETLGNPVYTIAFFFLKCDLFTSLEN